MTVLRGPEAVGACELLDHVGGWVVLLPEWASVRGRVQHDPWHRYTVDGHAFAAAAEVSRLLEQDERAARTARPPATSTPCTWPRSSTTSARGRARTTAWPGSC